MLGWNKDIDTNETKGDTHLHHARLLFDGLNKRRLVKARPSLRKWARELAALARDEQLTDDELEQLIVFIVEHTFKTEWVPRVRSATAFCLKFDSIVRQYRQHSRHRLVLDSVDTLILASDPIVEIKKQCTPNAASFIPLAVKDTSIAFRAFSLHCRSLKADASPILHFFMTASDYDFGFNWWGFIRSSIITRSNWLVPLDRYTFDPMSELTMNFVSFHWESWFCDADVLREYWFSQITCNRRLSNASS